MSAGAPSDTGVHRLVDMVVEEVSLVDRPANKQRFLIVKRDEEMARAAGAKGKAAPPKGKGPKDKPPAGAEDPKDPMDEEEEVEEPTAPKPPPPGKGKKPAKKAEDGSLLSAALSALEGLTAAVEILATVGEDEAGPQLGELAEELDELADRLATAAGAPPPDTGEEGEDPGGFAPGTEDGSVGKALAAVRETIKRVRAVVAAAERTTTKTETTPPPDAGAPAAPAPVAKNEAAELREEVKKLRELLGGQQERLVALEKGVGLPNSASADERPEAGRGDEDDESWPLDMNKPRDRRSVDKSLSFHEEA